MPCGGGSADSTEMRSASIVFHEDDVTLCVCVCAVCGLARIGSVCEGMSVIF